MECDLHCVAELPLGKELHHRIAFAMDVTVIDVLRTVRAQDIGQRLLQQEHAIRRELSSILMKDMIPDILRKIGLPDGHRAGCEPLDASIHIQSAPCVGSVPIDGEHVVFIKDQMNVTMEMSTDRPVFSVEALSAHRAGLVSSLADELMRWLKVQFLKVQDTSVRATLLYTDDAVEQQQRRVRSSAEGN